MPEPPLVLGAQELAELRPGAALRHDPVADVRAIEAADEHARLCQAQLGRDLAPGRRIGGRGQRDAGHLGPALVQDGELEILGAEVVAPLRHAMRFVDREQRDRQPVEPGEKAVGEQPLRRDVEKVDLAGSGPTADPALLLGRQAGVQELGADAELTQRRHLILHQGDERADDDGGAVAEQGRDLIAQRLAAAGGHDDERVAAAHDAPSRSPPAGLGRRRSRRRRAGPNADLAAGSRHRSEFSWIHLRSPRGGQRVQHAPGGCAATITACRGWERGMPRTPVGPSP